MFSASYVKFRTRTSAMQASHARKRGIIRLAFPLVVHMVMGRPEGALRSPASRLGRGQPKRAGYLHGDDFSTQRLSHLVFYRLRCGAAIGISKSGVPAIRTKCG